MLQFSHNQHVSAGMARMSGGGHTVEQWAHTTTPMGGWVTPGGDQSDNYSQADIDSDMSDQKSDAGTECEFSASFSDNGSLDISLPSETSKGGFCESATPRTGSPALTGSSPQAGITSEEEWIKLEV
jgi:hypothetical protein